MEPWIDVRVPAARVDGLIVTGSKNEVLVYDTGSHHIHHLNQFAAAVWNLCDGNRTVTDLARQVQPEVDGVVTPESVRLALARLGAANLLAGEMNMVPRDTAQSRRAFLRRSAIAGAVTFPVIVSISAPQSAGAWSACLSPGECNASNVGQTCATSPSNCATSTLRCWQVPVGPPGSYFCGAQP